MSSRIHSLAAGAILLLIPVAIVAIVKQTAWGPVLATPQARQIGGPAAKVAIVEYSDFQCPSCAHMQPVVHSFVDYYHGRVRLAYKYFPLTKMHKNALNSAHAAQCAAEQNKFWPYGDALFATQISWAELADPTTTFMAIARQVQLDPGKFQTCYGDPKELAPIERDMEEGRKRQVSATPTFFVGEERIVGGNFANEGSGVIERQLRK